MSRLSKYRNKPLSWWLSTPLYAVRIIHRVAAGIVPNLINTRPLFWKLAGSPLPAPPITRRAILRDYALKYNLKIFIETGTWHGGTVSAMIPYVDKIYSIELSERLFQIARKKFSKKPSVNLLHGDSTDVLPMILEQIDSPALFWLDGHYSWGVTAHGTLETPIDAEMRSVLQYAQRDEATANSVILIDDARDFGRGDYPAIDSLRVLVKDHFPHADFRVEMDIIRIVLNPTNRPNK